MSKLVVLKKSAFGEQLKARGSKVYALNANNMTKTVKVRIRLLEIFCYVARCPILI